MVTGYGNGNGCWCWCIIGLPVCVYPSPHQVSFWHCGFAGFNFMNLFLIRHISCVSGGGYVGSSFLYWSRVNKGQHPKKWAHKYFGHMRNNIGYYMNWSNPCVRFSIWKPPLYPPHFRRVHKEYCNVARCRLGWGTWFFFWQWSVSPCLWVAVSLLD